MAAREPVERSVEIPIPRHVGTRYLLPKRERLELEVLPGEHRGGILRCHPLTGGGGDTRVTAVPIWLKSFEHS